MSVNVFHLHPKCFPLCFRLLGRGKCFPFASKIPGPLYGMTGRSLRQGLAVKHLLAKQQTVAPESIIIGRGCPLILPSNQSKFGAGCMEDGVSLLVLVLVGVVALMASLPV